MIYLARAEPKRPRQRPKGVPEIAAPPRPLTVTSTHVKKRLRPDESLDQAASDSFTKKNVGAQRKALVRADPVRKAVVPALLSAVASIATRHGAMQEFWESDALAALTSYAAMPTGYRQFREDALVRKCVVLRATWATKAGFDTILEPTKEIVGADGKPDEKAKEAYLKQFQDLKDYIDRCNRIVKMDFKLRNMLIRAKLQGKAVQQIVWADKVEKGLGIGDPRMLVPLRPDLLKPFLAKDWTFVGISYKGRGSLQNPAYTADELLYFVNEDLDEDKVGLSDVEPILWVIEARQRILQDDLPEAVTALWCATILWLLNREKLTGNPSDDDVAAILKAHVAAVATPAKHVATTTQFETPIVVDMKPDLDKLVNVLHELDYQVIRNWTIPRFLVGYEQEVNRATALQVTGSFIDGPVKDDQRWLKRNIESQWYEPLAKKWLIRNQKMQENEDPPVRVVHQPRELQYEDWLDLMKAITEAYAGGMGWITTKKAFEIMQRGRSTQFKPEEVEEKQTQDIPLDFFARPKKLEQKQEQKTDE